MIEITKGNLVTADAEALVNTVNCVGVMGKGVALQFKKAFPENYEFYRETCEAGEMRIGKVLVFETGAMVGPKYIINFPTKEHWRGRSKLEHIEAGLESLVAEIRARNIASIAVPPLGCGNGGLNWRDVEPLITKALSPLEMKVLLFEPGYVPAAGEQPVRGQRPRLTRFKAMLVKLLTMYGAPGYEITALEAQKLAWFLARTGERTGLQFVKGTYGPYSERLNYPLHEMDGHYLKGIGDRSKVRSQIVVIPSAPRLADSVLASESTALYHVDTVFRLIRGFETPYGMELLSTVDWVRSREDPPAMTVDEAIEKIALWSDRKSRLFPRSHVERTWERLAEFELLPA